MVIVNLPFLFSQCSLQIQITEKNSRDCNLCYHWQLPVEPRIIFSHNSFPVQFNDGDSWTSEILYIFCFCFATLHAGSEIFGWRKGTWKKFRFFRSLRREMKIICSDSGAIVREQSWSVLQPSRNISLLLTTSMPTRKGILFIELATRRRTFSFLAVI